MKTTINFRRDERGQGQLIKYILLVAFIALASAALFMGAGNNGIWNVRAPG